MPYAAIFLLMHDGEERQEEEIQENCIAHEGAYIYMHGLYIYPSSGVEVVQNRRDGQLFVSAKL